MGNRQAATAAARDDRKGDAEVLFQVIDAAQLATFAGIWVAAAAAPGGNTAFTVSVSSRYGFGAGLVGALGFATVLMAYTLFVVFGLGFAVSQYGLVLDVLRWLGVGYLLYLAYRMWIARAVARLDGSFEAAAYPKLYLQGALICFTNPKVMIFIAVVLPQAVDGDRPLVPQFLVLGLCGALSSLFVHSVYSVLGHTLGRSVPTPRARRICNRIIAAVFVIAAVGLSLSSL